MKRWLVITAILLVAVTAFAQVSGRVVVRSNTGVVGVPHAIVQFYAPNASPILIVPRAVTDRHGNFTVNDIRPGTYAVIATARGYVQTARVNVTVTEHPTPVRVIVPMRQIRNTGIRNIGVE